MPGELARSGQPREEFFRPFKDVVRPRTPQKRESVGTSHRRQKRLSGHWFSLSVEYFDPETIIVGINTLILPGCNGDVVFCGTPVLVLGDARTIAAHGATVRVSKGYLKTFNAKHTLLYSP